MDYELYQEVALLKSIPKTKFKKWDVATIIEIKENNGKHVFTLEFYTALGDPLGTHEVSMELVTHLLPNSIVTMRML
jgi:hypothetical protein